MKEAKPNFIWGLRIISVENQWDARLGLGSHLNFPVTFVSKSPSPTNIYLLKVNNRNSSKRCDICSKLTIKIPERRHLHCSGVFIVNFKQI